MVGDVKAIDDMKTALNENGLVLKIIKSKCPENKNSQRINREFGYDSPISKVGKQIWQMHLGCSKS